MEPKEKLISSNILDLVDPSEKYKLEEYFPFIRCIKCLEVGYEPRQCLTCNFVLCQKCKICAHSLVQSRHVKLILDQLTFKCKFNRLGCTSTIKYSEIRQHLLKCKYLETESIPENKSNKLTDSFQTEKNSTMKNYSSKSNSNNNLNNIKDSSLFSSSNFKHEDYEGKINVPCVKCRKSFNNKNEFIEHYKICANNKSKEDTLNEFSYCHEKLEKKFLSYIQDKINERKTTQVNHFNQFENFLLNKRNQIKAIEANIFKLSSEDNTREDPEYVEIINKESQLHKTKSNLNEILNKKIQEYDKIIQLHEIELEMTICEHKNILLALELEEKWVKEDLESSMFCSDFNDKCITCGNSEQSVKKYSCQSCREKFCVDKCAKLCKTKDCNKFICPKEGNDCKLCHKLNYCDTCQKKCFYQLCLNTFCPECYKKNEHQTRNANIKCKFITCEKDQVCDCLMTTLFCPKCEKRLCNKCLINDKEHFPFLK